MSQVKSSQVESSQALSDLQPEETHLFFFCILRECPIDSYDSSISKLQQHKRGLAHVEYMLLLASSTADIKRDSRSRKHRK